MKDLLRSVAMALRMFSVVPVPNVAWKKENMKYMLCALPLVGAVIGLALWLWFLLCDALDLGDIPTAAGWTLIPVLLSGGIHLDGFCDTVDALSSHAPPEKKRAILKDSHAGAFAVIYCGVFLLGFFALCTALPMSAAGALALGLQQMLSRALGCLCSVCFASAGEGLQRTFRDAADGRAAAILIVWSVLCAAGLCVLSPAGGAAAVIVYLLCLRGLRRMSRREFGGMSGDLAGYLITLSQGLMLLAYLLAERAVELL